jgi:hypothetical protein
MSALPAFDRAISDLGYRADYAQGLRDIAAIVGYRLDHKPFVRLTRDRRKASVKPWHILYSDGTLVASFRTLDALEVNLRGRCGC